MWDTREKMRNMNPAPILSVQSELLYEGGSGLIRSSGVRMGCNVAEGDRGQGTREEEREPEIAKKQSIC